MKLKIKQICIPLCTVAMVFICGTLSANILTIGNGSTFTINGGTLDVNCNDILIKDGGTLELQTGILRDKKNLNIDGSGVYTYTSGTVFQCGENSFFLIFNKDGKPIIFAIPRKSSM